MAKTIDDYRQMAQSMVEADKPLIDEYDKYDKLYFLDWELPKAQDGVGLPKWVEKRITKMPYEMVAAAEKAFATMEPNINLSRPSASEGTRAYYNKIENAFQYQFMKSSKRPGGSLVQKMLRYATLYGGAIANPTHVSAHLDNMGDIPASLKRDIRAAGDFIVPIHGPRNVYVRYNDVYLDAVLLVRVMTLAAFEKQWGKLSEPITKRAGDDKSRDDRYVVYYDYMDHEARVMWGDLQPSSAIPNNVVSGIMLRKEEHGLGFLPWAARYTENRKGLLYPLIQTEAWEKANLAESLMQSEKIKTSAAPLFAVKNANGAIIYNYGEPGSYVDLPPGAEIIPLPQPKIDQGLIELAERGRREMQLVPDVIISGQPEPGEAFSALNTRISRGLSSFTPYREVAERLCEDIIEIEIKWLRKLGKPLSGVVKNRTGVRSEPFEVNMDEFTNLGIEVELKPDMPVDRQSNVMTAIQAVRDLGWPLDYANTQLGENDPEQLLADKALETMKQAELAGVVGNIQAEAQLVLQAKMSGVMDLVELAQTPEGQQALQMLKQALAQQEAGGGQMAAPPGQGTPPNPDMAQGISGVEGAGFDPNQGGLPPDQMQPGASSQPQQTRFDRNGEPV